MTLPIDYAQNVRLSHVQKRYYSGNTTGICFEPSVRISHKKCDIRTDNGSSVDLSVNFLLLPDKLVA